MSSTNSGPPSPTPSSISFPDLRRPSWGHQRTWSTSILPLSNERSVVMTVPVDSQHDSTVQVLFFSASFILFCSSVSVLFVSAPHLVFLFFDACFVLFRVSFFVFHLCCWFLSTVTKTGWCICTYILMLLVQNFNVHNNYSESSYFDIVLSSLTNNMTIRRRKSLY